MASPGPGLLTGSSALPPTSPYAASCRMPMSLAVPLSCTTTARVTPPPAGRRTRSIPASMRCCRASRPRAGNSSSAPPSARISLRGSSKNSPSAAIFLPCTRTRAGSLHHTKTALLRRLLEEQSLDPAATYMVGDRNFDIEAARANSVTSIAVTYGYATPEELESARPDYTCDAVEDLAPDLLCPRPSPIVPTVKYA